MAKKHVHFRIRSPEGCKEFRTTDPGRKGHTKVTFCLRKPGKGEKPSKGREYKSEVQRLLVEKGTGTFKSDIKRAKRFAAKACKAKGKKLVKVGEDYKCK